MSRTEAQEEFQQFVDKNNRTAAYADNRYIHPEDRLERQREAGSDDYNDLDEEDRYRTGQIDNAMRIPTFDTGAASNGMKLPPASFDNGRATGVKGVIADARNYEEARKNTWANRVRQARRSVFGGPDVDRHKLSDSDEDDHDEESFLAQWRDSRRRELESETRSGAAVRMRRTSPSVRVYGRLDVVDALGYLDAIEKVGRETVVVVFVYDHECEVSSAAELALMPLVKANPTVHFVKVHYEDIEFDNAAVPTILAYRNQGDLFANLTGLIELLPGDEDDEEDFGTDTLRKLLQDRDIL